MCPSISSGSWRSSAITATPSSSAGRGVGEHLQRLEPERAGVVVGPHRRVAELGAARRQRRRRPRGRARRRRRSRGSRLLEQRDASTCGVCGNMSTGFTRRSYSRPRRAEPRSAPASSGCRRRRRSAAPRTRAAGGRSSSRGPTRGGSTTTTSGRARLARAAARSRAGRRRATKRALSIPFAAALCSASATASGTPSRPQTSPACAGEREADRADPAVEVEDALAAGEPGELAGDRVEALGHLGVGLQEGGVGDAEAAGPQSSSSRCSAPSTPVGPVGAAGRALDHGVQVDRRARDLGRRR